MDFDFKKYSQIFNSFFQSRPEVDQTVFQQDIQRYYLPFVSKLIQLKKKKTDNQGMIVGISAIQGAGKTTQGEILEILLKHFGYSSVSQSIDDHYVTHAELCDIRRRDPRFIRRGVTHDIPLAILNLRDLQQMNEAPIIISGYDKGANQGDGERFRWVNLQPGMKINAQIVDEELIINKQKQTTLVMILTSLEFNGHQIGLPERMGADLPIIEPLLSKELVEFLMSQKGQSITIEQLLDDQVNFTGMNQYQASKKDLPNGWKVIAKKPDFIFYDGWMLGAIPVQDESVFTSNLPALETADDQLFAKMVNQKLMDYQPLWQMIEFMNVLYVPNYQISLNWRDQAEEILRAKGEGMTQLQITDFVHYFWRSVHPGIHIKRLAHDSKRTQQVVVINDDHSVGEILTPDQTAQKYP